MFDWSILPGSGPSSSDIPSGEYKVVLEEWNVGSTQHDFAGERNGRKLSRPAGCRYYHAKTRIMENTGTDKTLVGMTLSNTWFVGMDHLSENDEEVVLSDPEAIDPKTWTSDLNWDVSRLNRFVQATAAPVEGLHPDEIGDLVRGNQLFLQVEKTARKSGGFFHKWTRCTTLNEATITTPAAKKGGTTKKGLRDCEMCDEKVQVAEYAAHLKKHKEEYADTYSDA